MVAPKKSDGRHVYGACCAWHGSIEQASTMPTVGLPCCPHCQGVLLEIPQAIWDKGIAEFDAQHPGYAGLVKWVGEQDRCIPLPISNALKAYNEATGSNLVLPV